MIVTWEGVIISIRNKKASYNDFLTALQKKQKEKKGKKVRSVLFIHRRKIKSPNSAGKAEEHGDGFICDRPGSVNV
jgi:hypothetical protein